jgi:serine/threonine-protein kinase HipA
MKNLIVKLNDTAVGDLRHRSGDSWEFRFRTEYIDLHHRPVLSQFFEDDLLHVHRSNLSLPPFFSNLLPEGPLRELVAQQREVNEQREALLLEALGKDLPGAVVVEQSTNGNGHNGVEPQEEEIEAPKHVPLLKFSLAGVQLKFSVLRRSERLTLPVTGQGGDWIVKLPAANYPRVPANEFSMLRWAHLAGIEVPEHELVPVTQIQGLPSQLQFPESEAFAIRRYDRNPNGRVHQEDFAQVLGLYPSKKYSRFNYETIANIIHAVAGPEALLEYARRLTFVILSGNGDAHHKNWSFLYPDGRRATLAPAYDLVFTKAYIADDDLALKFNGSRRFSDVTLEGFRRLARKANFDEVQLSNAVMEAAERIREIWRAHGAEMPIEAQARAKLDRHLSSVRI